MTCLNATAIALPIQGLREFAEAEKELLSSLKTRIDSLGRIHGLVFNTYRQLADLFLNPDNLDEAKARINLEACLEIGTDPESPVAKKKVVNAAKDMAALLRKAGEADAAAKLEEAHGLPPPAA